MDFRFLPAMRLAGKIYDCGEAVPALRPAGIPSTTLRRGLSAAGNKGKMPSPHWQSAIGNRKLSL